MEEYKLFEKKFAHEKIVCARKNIQFNTKMGKLMKIRPIQVKGYVKKYSGGNYHARM